MSSAVTAPPCRITHAALASLEHAGGAGSSVVDDLFAAALSEAEPVYRNVYVAGRKTSVRLEIAMWRVLDDIRDRESCTLDELVARARQLILKRICISTLLRCLAISYLQSAVTEEGHAWAGHGTPLRK
jgi:predicted DNA-binding ribbon-helix-helix protein